MTKGKAFTLHGIGMTDPIVPIRFHCVKCDTEVMAELLEDFLNILGEDANYLRCLSCNPHWMDVMAALGRTHRDGRRIMLLNRIILIGSQDE